MVFKKIKQILKLFLSQRSGNCLFDGADFSSMFKVTLVLMKLLLLILLFLLETLHTKSFDFNVRKLQDKGIAVNLYWNWKFGLERKL